MTTEVRGLPKEQFPFEVGEKVAYMDHGRQELVTGWVHLLHPSAVAVRLNEFRNGKQVVVLCDYDELVQAV